MATIKSYTDLSQSKTLSKILPLESADMHYWWKGQKLGVGHSKELQEGFESKGIEYTPCWSLAALLNVIPKHIKDYNVLRIDISENEFAIWYDEIGYGVNNDLPDITMESAVDACYELILKLNELKML